MLLLVAVVAAISAASSASGATRLPLVVAFEPAPFQGRGLAVRPNEIDYALTEFLAGRTTSGSQRPRWGRLRWRSWTSHQATGSGYDAIQKTNCDPIPTCGYSFYASTVQLYRPRREHGYWLFTRMRITYTKKRPPDTPRSRTFNVIYVSGAFNWRAAF
jgi:hypothetical protein